MHFNLQPTLENDLLILQPLKEEDFETLYAVASDPLIWEQHPDKTRCQREGFNTFFKLAMETKGAFLVKDKKTNEVIGSTRFFPVKGIDNAIEIGWTFLARKYWGGEYNSSMKNLLMNYAFGFVDNIVFYIHEQNMRSRKAVEKMGGKLSEQIDGLPLEPRQPSVSYKIVKK